MCTTKVYRFVFKMVCIMEVKWMAERTDTLRVSLCDLFVCSTKMYDLISILCA